MIYRDNHLDAIHSSTPAVQFVRLDVASPEAVDVLAGEEAAVAAHPARVYALSFNDLSTDLRQTAQRAFYCAVKLRAIAFRVG